MSKTHIRIALVVAGVALASVAFAAGAPGNVSRVDAKIENGKLVVEWDAATDAAGISSYRVYYSRKSILDNGGDYDDYEQTADEKTRYEFPRFPYNPGTKVYVAVMAVNTSGIESDAFEAEASVDLPSDTVAQPEQPASEASSSSSQEPTDFPNPSTMGVDHVAATDNTTVTVAFTEPLADDQDIGQGYFIIVDEDGGVLDITGYAKDGSTVTLTTASQAGGKRYILGILQRIRGQDGAIVDGTAPQSSFAGVAKPEESSSSSEQSSSSSAPADVYGRNPNLPPTTGSQNFLDLLRNRSGQATLVNPQQQVNQNRDTVPPEDASNLLLQPVLRKDGTYNVTAAWRGSPNRAGDLAGYAVAVSDNGFTYVPSSTVGANQTVIQYTRIQPGTFGVRVSAFDATGNRSAGVDKVVTLPQSGLPLLGVAAVSGIAAMRRVRRKRVA